MHLHQLDRGARRGLSLASIAMAVGTLLSLGAVARGTEGKAPTEGGAIDVGGRLELLVDRALVESSRGLTHRIHRPVADQVALHCDRPWEGNTSAYFTVFHDGAKYRMYYRGSHWDTAAKRATHPEVACYAESDDGLNWVKPSLGLFEFAGSKDNNIVMAGIATHNFTPFFDTRPGCPPESRYKAVGLGPKGLFAFQSADAVRWTKMDQRPVITKGAFDSQNLAFWDSHLGKYREYHRSFIGGVRAITTSVSDDFLQWTEPAPLSYGDAPNEHLYTNAIRPHPRAPHLLLGFPTRYHPDRNSQVEPTLMASRDGQSFFRHLEAVIPVTAPQDRMGNRSNYMAWGLVDVVGDESLEAVYATEAYYEGPDSRLRRFLYRKDRYASFSHGNGAEAGAQESQSGELVTKPLLLRGATLTLNHDTAEGGELRVELQEVDGRPIPGFSLADCQPLRGDHSRQAVSWGPGRTLKSLAGKPVRLRLSLRDSDLFALQCAP